MKELGNLLKTQQDDVRERNRQIEEGVFRAINDPKRPLQAPKMERVPPALNFAPLENAAEMLTQAAARYRKAADAARPKAAANLPVIRQVNVRVMQAERQLIDGAGLPRRPWYRHLLYAPGFYTGYAVKTMPGVREAIEQKEYAEAESEIGRVAKALEREAMLLDGASAQLETIR
ncbi:MAG TPA: transferrin receptor-like dimerization domain-containing protein [Vicinamibacterales bacterium]|nr:transferrin receptor-like dimerization domain-containing protein [Vicinamibacterales bacterium]